MQKSSAEWQSSVCVVTNEECAGIAVLLPQDRRHGRVHEWQSPGLPTVVKLGLAFPHPEGLSGVVHRTNGARVIDTRKEDVGGGVGWSGPLPEPPAVGRDPTLVCLALTLYRAATHSCGHSATGSAPSSLRWGPRRWKVQEWLGRLGVVLGLERPWVGGSWRAGEFGGRCEARG